MHLYEGINIRDTTVDKVIFVKYLAQQHTDSSLTLSLNHLPISSLSEGYSTKSGTKYYNNAKFVYCISCSSEEITKYLGQYYLIHHKQLFAPSFIYSQFSVHNNKKFNLAFHNLRHLYQQNEQARTLLRCI